MKKKKSSGFIMLEHSMIRSEAWQNTSFGARCLLLEIWARHNGKNNGAIPFSHNEAVKLLGIGRSTAGRFFKELEDNGFLVATRRGSFDWKSGAAKGRATEWRLTMLPENGTGNHIGNSANQPLGQNAQP